MTRKIGLVTCTAYHGTFPPIRDSEPFPYRRIGETYRIEIRNGGVMNGIMHRVTVGEESVRFTDAEGRWFECSRKDWDRVNKERKAK